MFGWLLTCLGQEFGFPVPVGGASGITDTLVHRAGSRGVELRCRARVDRVLVEGAKATGVVTEHGDRMIPAHNTGGVLRPGGGVG